MWIELVDWWKKMTNSNKSGEILHNRLKESIQDNKIEFLLFEVYYNKMGFRLKEKLPALIPQVYLHYDPYTIRQL